MSYIGQAPGLGQRVPFRFVAYMGQTKFTGLDATGYPLGYTPGLIDVFVNGRLLSEPDYTASDGSTLTIATPLDFGTEVRVLAQTPWSPANTYTIAQADSFQRRRNRIIDPGMRVSQENGSNLVTLTAVSTPYYPSDGVFALRAGTTGMATVQRIAQATPGGSPYRNRLKITAVNAAPAAGDVLFFDHRIEGLDVADLRFGTSSARTIGIRFGVNSSVAGTFPVAVRNGSAATRSYLGSFSISPGEVGQDIVKTIIVPGDTVGTWATDNTLGLDLILGLCCGTTYQGAQGWQAGQFYGLSTGINLMATNGATFDLFDVGLYDVTGLQQGVIPPFELGHYVDDLMKCLRYYETSYPIGWTIGSTGSGASGLLFYARDGGSSYHAIHRYAVEKRITPSLVGYASSGDGRQGSFFDYTQNGPNGNIGFYNVSTKGFQFANTSGSWTTGYQIGFHFACTARI